MHVDAIKAMLRQITDLLETMWIERAGFRNALRNLGYADDQLKALADRALADPELQKQARQAYAQMRHALLDEASPVVIEALSEDPPPSGEPN